MTANAMEGDRDKCLAAGMDDYLSKPYTLAQLESMLAHWLQPHTIPPRPTTTQQIAHLKRQVRARSTCSFLNNPRSCPSGGLIKNLMRAYLDTSGNTLRQIQQAVAMGDADGLRRSAHTLKSSSANVGAETLSGLFRQMEALGKEGNQAAAASLLGEMRWAYAHAVRGIRALPAAT